MIEEKQRNNEERPEKEISSPPSESGLISSFFTFLFWLVISSTLLWNWDGFWQTDTKFLNKAQKQFFSTKYSEEQLKVSRITRNNNLIDDINDRIDKVVRERESVIAQLDKANAELKRYKTLETEKCRYLDSSLRMIDHLIRKYSDDELRRVLTCTSEECEKVLNERRKVTAICT